MSDLETSSPKLGNFGVMLDGLRRSQSDVNLSTGQYYSDSPAHRLLRARPAGMIRSLSSSPRPASPAPSSPHDRATRPNFSPEKQRIPSPAPPSPPGQPRRSRILLVLAAAFALWLTLHSFRHTLVLFRFKLRDEAYEEGWVGCGLRKKPLVFVRGSDEASVVFEANCEDAFGVEWGAQVGPTKRSKAVAEWKVADVKMIKMHDETNTHYAYSAVLGSLEPNTEYAYKITRLPDATQPSSAQPLKPTLLASHSFPWVSSTPPVTPSGLTTLHFATLADNQFNVRTFHRVLLALLRHARKRHRLTAPPLLLHAGDQVQNPHNLAQWQTDFWDALTSVLPVPLGQTTPILQARGNHDWDSTGVNAYVGGTPPRRDWVAASGRERRERDVGTYMSYSLHERVRVLVLDSNLSEVEQKEQEEWLLWELGRKEWKEASLRIVMVHVAPFLQFWDTRAWNEGGESQWSSYVRHRLTPILSQHHATLVLSGHQHAYSRGFLPAALHRAHASVDHATDLPALAKAAAAERAWEKKQRVGASANDRPTEGTVYAVFGGAGGTLDEDRVEEWGFYEKSVKGRYHFGWVKVEMGGEAVAGEKGKGRKREKGVRVYEQRKVRECGVGEREVVDRLEWEAVAVEGDVMDRFVIEAGACERL